MAVYTKSIPEAMFYNDLLRFILLVWFYIRYAELSNRLLLCVEFQ